MHRKIIRNKQKPLGCIGDGVRREEKGQQKEVSRAQCGLRDWEDVRAMLGDASHRKEIKLF